MQDDALLQTATPREALRFSASMRLPASVSQETIEQLVDQLLEDLGLTACADVMIGGALIKGISGGQRKRTSVGVELITDPALLFLDEPTSGLDSYSAFSIVTLMKKVAQKNCTILCTIHQPSSEVFFLFDIVIFMKDGRIFYQGPVDQIVPHFGKAGYSCPHNYNPSDFIMSLSQTESNATIEAKGLFMNAPHSLEDDGQKSLKLDKAAEFTSESSFLKQVAHLTHREWINTCRDTAALMGRYGVTIILNVLFGLIFLNAGGKDNANNTDFNSHFGAITMVMISGMFGSAQPIMLSFPYERPMFLREYSTGTYGVTAYFFSKLLVEIPMNFVQALVQFILVYFMLDLQGNFIFIVLACFGLGMCASSVAVVLGCAVSDVKDVTELAPLLFVPQMLFVGFFVRTSQIPIFLRWAQYLCSLKYAMNLVLLTEFNSELSSCKGDAAENCRNILKNNNVEPDQFWVYIILLFVLFAGFRFIAGMVLMQKAKRFY